MTTFGTPAFSASWGPSSGGFSGPHRPAMAGQQDLRSARDHYRGFLRGEIGEAGGYSYIGIYGWSQNPCIEWYIVDDAYNGLPFNPGNTTNKGTLTVDGGTYTLYLRATTGTGGNRCGNTVTSWNQFYSMRQTARACGTISISQHFAAWKAAGMTLGSMLEASVLVEGAAARKNSIPRGQRDRAVGPRAVGDGRAVISARVGARFQSSCAPGRNPGADLCDVRGRRLGGRACGMCPPIRAP